MKTFLSNHLALLELVLLLIIIGMVIFIFSEIKGQIEEKRSAGIESIRSKVFLAKEESKVETFNINQICG